MNALEIIEAEGPNQSRILTLKGPLTLNTLFDFQTLVRTIASPVLIVDLANVPYMDSAGLGCLLGAFASAQHHTRKFAVASTPPRIVTLFQVAHVDTLIPQYATVDAALAQLSAKP
jgi:anti-sigma B factor antagonist